MAYISRITFAVPDLASRYERYGDDFLMITGAATIPTIYHHLRAPSISVKRQRRTISPSTGEERLIVRDDAESIPFKKHARLPVNA